MKLGTSIGTKKKNNPLEWETQPGTKSLVRNFIFFLLFFLDDENRSRLSDSRSDLSIFASLFIELPVCVSLAVSVLWIYPLRL